MAGSESLDTASTSTVGPIVFGPTTSGTGTVVFGTSNPAATAAISNLTANPWMLAAAGAVVLGIAYLYFRSKRR